MKRREFLGTAAAMGAAAWSRCGAAQDAPARRPNILWITCEDIGPHLGCYGDSEARTPNLDRLASQGVRYTRAFSVSGVCAPNRSCLVTGMYPTSLGTCHMRCVHPPKPPVRCFPAYLREAGYFCTNNSKTDYQFPVPPDAWDECDNKAHWRNRPGAGQPFFAVFNFTITHESQIGKLWPEDNANVPIPRGEWHDPAKAALPPYYPDTPVIRKHWAHYYDLITAMDRQAGEILQQLEEDGFAENTVVFFYSDHGAGLPRAKRWLYDSGLHVPFLVRWPGHVEADQVTDRMVSFVDFAPTALSIAGLPVPKHLQGRAFLGESEATSREYIFAARDRMDERYDLIRAVRDKRFKYIRNYMPYQPYDAPVRYQEGWPVMQEMRREQAAGRLSGPTALYFRQVKPIEELYDTEADPHELVNLAEAPEQAETLNRLRKPLNAWIRDVGDIGFVPEMELEAWLDEARNPAAAPPAYAMPAGIDSETPLFGRPMSVWLEDLGGNERLPRLHAVAALSLAGASMTPLLLAALKDPDGAVVYWAAAALADLEPPAEGVVEALKTTLERTEPSARLAAARTLIQLGEIGAGLPATFAGARERDEFVRLYAFQTLENLEPKTDEMRRLFEQGCNDENGYVVRTAQHALGIPAGSDETGIAKKLKRAKK